MRCKWDRGRAGESGDREMGKGWRVELSGHHEAEKEIMKRAKGTKIGERREG